MNKLSKALVLVLLLAVVVSSFGVFASFAEELTGDTSAESGVSDRVVVWDMESIYTKSTTYGDAKNKLDVVKDGDKSYIQQSTKPDGGGQFWTITLPSPASTDAATAKNAIVIQDMFKYDSAYKPLDENGDGKYDVKHYKNTDYVVVDFDISTDSQFLDSINFHYRWNADAITGSLARIMQNGKSYITLNENVHGDTVAIGNTYYTNKTYYGDDEYTPLFDSGKKWTNVTIVYDYSAVLPAEEIDAAGNTSWNEYKGYIYIDGYYVGPAETFVYRDLSNATYDPVPSTRYAKRFETIRMEHGSYVEGATTNWDNFTISKFPVGCTGDITTKLGDANITLGEINDLKYCLEGCIDDPIDNSVMAVVSHEDGSSDKYNKADDISGNLVNGDTVYVNRVIPTDYIVVSEGDTIYWKDAEGNDLAADSPLMPKLVTVPAGIDWAVIVNGEVTASGVAEDIKLEAKDLNGDGDAVDGLYTNGKYAYKDKSDSTYKTWVSEKAASVTDPLYAAINGTKTTSASSVTKVMLFGDVTTYGAGYNKTYKGVVNSATATKSVAGRVTFDLNGHELTVMPYYFHYLTLTTDGDASIENGSLNFVNVNGNLYYTGASSSQTAKFKNLSKVTIAGTMFDQRGGNFIVENCPDVNTGKYMLVSSKSMGGTQSGVYIINSTVVSECENGQINIKNVSDSNGSYNIVCLIKNSNMTNSGGHTVFIRAYRNSAGESQACIDNDNFVNVSVIDNSVINSGSNAFIFTFAENADAETDLYVNVEVSDSDIICGRALYMGAHDDSYTKTYEWSEDVNIAFVGDTSIKATKGLVGISSSRADIATVGVYLADGVKMYVPDIMVSTSPALKVPVDVAYDNENSMIVRTSQGGDCDYIVSSSYDKYTYQLVEQAPEEFFWNKADGEQVNIDKVVTLPTSECYEYSWNIDGKAYVAVSTLKGHTDANKDHACDYGCSDFIGECADADKDHACDYGCDKIFGECEDTDKDHDCDYGCDKTFG